MKKKLIIMHPKYGDVTVMEGEVVTTEGEYKGLSLNEAFDKIMTAGYGGKSPVVFIGEKPNGDTIKGNKELLNNPEVETIYAFAPICGG